MLQAHDRHLSLFNITAISYTLKVKQRRETTQVLLSWISEEKDGKTSNLKYIKEYINQEWGSKSFIWMLSNLTIKKSVGKTVQYKNISYDSHFLLACWSTSVMPFRFIEAHYTNHNLFCIKLFARVFPCCKGSRKFNELPSILLTTMEFPRSLH